MKNIIVLTSIVFTTFLTNAQTTISNDLYTVIYSESYEQPLELTYSYPQYDIVAYYNSPREYGFSEMENGKYKYIIYPTPSVTKIYSWEVPAGIITSDDADYEDNDYDRGHLVPKKQFDDKGNISFLYSYLNCALMHETLNSGVWSSLEEYERNLPGSVSVTVKLTFSDPNNKVVGGATIPSHFTKIIKFGGAKYFSDDHIEEVYKFPNDGSVKGKSIDYFKIEEN